MATLGIDFGTSNSACGVLVDGRPWLVEIEPGEKTMPTAVFFDFDSRDTLFGASAHRALIDGREGRYMRALKSVLGTALMHENRRIMGESLSFVDIVARFLAQLKAAAEAQTGRRFSRALSGRPVRFHSADAARDARALADLETCYLRAGFDAVAFLNEPEAAAIASGALADEDIGLIVDIGGGTSDFTLFRSGTDGARDVIGSEGVRIGGTTFDRTLSLDHVMPHLGLGGMIGNAFGSGALPAPRAMFQDLASWEKIPFLYTPQTLREVRLWARQAEHPRLFDRLAATIEDETGHDIAFAVERGKIAANRGERARIGLDSVERGLSVALERSDLERSLAEHARAIGRCAEATCNAAGVTLAEVGTIVYVGGSSLMEVVGAEMSRLFPAARSRRSDPFTAVANGLAIASATAFQN